MESWYLACYKTGWHNSFKAQLFLSNLGVVSFIPQVCVSKSRHDRPGHFRKVIEPLFPGYIFLSFDHEIHRISKIESCPGMRNIVRFGEEIKPINESVVDEIMCFTSTVEGNQITDRFTKGLSPAKRIKHETRKNKLLEIQRKKMKEILQETSGEVRSSLFYAFLEAI